MREISTIKEKILQYLDFKGVSKYDFYQKTGVSNGVLSQKSGLSEDNIMRFLSYYNDVNTEWLLGGSGEMLKTKSTENVIISNDNLNDNLKDNKPNIQNKLSNAPEESRVMIPLYDDVVVGGMQYQATLQGQTEPVEYVNAGDWFRDATAAMRVHGDSMFPEYKSGSIVALKKVNNLQLVIYGQDYVIETEEYRVIKRLQRSENKTCWLLASINTEEWESGDLKGRLIHEPIDLPIKDVKRCFRVLGCVTRTESSRIVFNEHATNK